MKKWVWETSRAVRSSRIQASWPSGSSGAETPNQAPSHPLDPEDADRAELGAVAHPVDAPPAGGAGGARSGVRAGRWRSGSSGPGRSGGGGRLGRSGGRGRVALTASTVALPVDGAAATASAAISAKNVMGAEREGFEPSRELLAPYSLSRRVPSAARPPLRGRRSPGATQRADCRLDRDADHRRETHAGAVAGHGHHHPRPGRDLPRRRQELYLDRPPAGFLRNTNVHTE